LCEIAKRGSHACKSMHAKECAERAATQEKMERARERCEDIGRSNGVSFMSGRRLSRNVRSTHVGGGTVAQEDP
jgi:hypothetical protein